MRTRSPEAADIYSRLCAAAAARVEYPRTAYVVAARAICESGPLPRARMLRLAREAWDATQRTPCPRLSRPARGPLSPERRRLLRQRRRHERSLRDLEAALPRAVVSRDWLLRQINHHRAEVEFLTAALARTP